MANPAIINNKLGSESAVVRLTASVTLAPSDFQLPNETVTDISLKRVFFSGNCTIAFGSNTVLTLVGTDHWLLDQSGAAFNANGASLVVTLGTGSTAVLVVGKKSTINANAAVAVKYTVNP